ncbi:MAG: M15 family metallopeptidase [Erysipelotrichaceae bacterium]|nr:M15 family metallopeptidase [Erysipelotrichaceae bacterium]
MKKKKAKKAILLIVVAILLSIVIFFNFGNICLLIKGYGLNELKKLNSVLSYSQLIQISKNDYCDNIELIIDDDNFCADNAVEYFNYISNNSVNDDIKTAIKIVNYGIDYPYSQKLATIVNDPYYINDLIDRYINYDCQDYQQIVQSVNCSIDYPYYTNTKPADLSKQQLVLVNKYNYLDPNYVPDDLVSVDLYHSYSGNSLERVALDNYIEMHSAALNDGIQLILFSGYRTYQLQNELWTTRSESKGIEYADEYTARAGYSEHQTGLALDITRYDSDDIQQAYDWLENNSYKFGFILRYPKDKENITGYSYEPWHFRYVGTQVAYQIYQEGITFDEYYAYYIADR